MNRRAAAALLTTASILAFPAVAGARASADGGGGTYVTSGRTYDFDLVDSGSTSWRSFYLVAPAGVRFVGGTTGNEASATCVVGQPDGSAAEIECGTFGPTIMPPQGHVAFVATVAGAPVCGGTFELFVAAGSAAYTRVDDVTAAADCRNVDAPKALVRPLLRGVPVVGSRIRATPPVWSSRPTAVRYRWERCAGARCTAIAGAAGTTLVLARREAGHAVRLVATATIGGVRVTTSSRELAVRLRRR